MNQRVPLVLQYHSGGLGIGFHMHILSMCGIKPRPSAWRDNTLPTRLPLCDLKLKGLWRTYQMQFEIKGMLWKISIYHYGMNVMWIEIEKRKKDPNLK